MRITHPLLSLPTSPEQATAMAARLLEHHRGTFGDARMSSDDPPEGNKGDKDKGGGDKGGDQGPKVNEHGYPDDTPVSDMEPAQQTAYWKHKARKWETNAKARDDYDAIKAERDQLRQAGMSADEKAVEDAKAQAVDAARAEERAKFGRQLVKAELRGALKGRVADDKLNAQVDFLDHSLFLTDSGEVDADKVSAYASGFGTAGPGRQQWPDTGQGNRGSEATAKGVDAGRDLWASRRKKSE